MALFEAWPLHHRGPDTRPRVSASAASTISRSRPASPTFYSETDRRSSARPRCIRSCSESRAFTPTFTAPSEFLGCGILLNAGSSYIRSGKFSAPVERLDSESVGFSLNGTHSGRAKLHVTHSKDKTSAARSGVFTNSSLFQFPFSIFIFGCVASADRHAFMVRTKPARRYFPAHP
jgi:hypothetical protein